MHGFLIFALPHQTFFVQDKYGSWYFSIGFRLRLHSGGVYEIIIFAKILSRGIFYAWLSTTLKITPLSPPPY